MIELDSEPEIEKKLSECSSPVIDCAFRPGWFNPVYQTHLPTQNEQFRQLTVSKIEIKSSQTTYCLLNLWSPQEIVQQTILFQCVLTHLKTHTHTFIFLPLFASTLHCAWTVYLLDCRGFIMPIMRLWYGIYFGTVLLCHLIKRPRKKAF